MQLTITDISNEKVSVFFKTFANKRFAILPTSYASNPEKSDLLFVKVHLFVEKTFQSFKSFDSLGKQNFELQIVRGLPPMSFVERAWASEPLTQIIRANIPFVLPMADEDISLLAKVNGEVVGQCSTNRLSNFWEKVKVLDTSAQDLDTQLFAKITQKAVAAEEEYLSSLGEKLEFCFHSAGIAVLPECRGKNLGLKLREKQIKLCKKFAAKILFCETTNRFSAVTVEKFGFVKVAEFYYPDLAVELEHEPLSELKDSFTVWCLKL